MLPMVPLERTAGIGSDAVRFLRLPPLPLLPTPAPVPDVDDAAAAPSPRADDLSPLPQHRNMLEIADDIASPPHSAPGGETPSTTPLPPPLLVPPRAPPAPLRGAMMLLVGDSTDFFCPPIFLGGMGTDGGPLIAPAAAASALPLPLSDPETSTRPALLVRTLPPGGVSLTLGLSFMGDVVVDDDGVFGALLVSLGGAMLPPYSELRGRLVPCGESMAEPSAVEAAAPSVVTIVTPTAVPFGSSDRPCL
mmetsp:Transcript_13113/g.28462  ORF Transcript_13113/g.28462 Transcript_13113/m.28462 type:complete len:249 (-) Transcript_13113:479-1225(-)